MTNPVVGRSIALLALGAMLLLNSACGPASPVGRWQQEGNPDAGFEIQDGGSFQGELGPAGARRVKLEGTWKAAGNDVTFALGGALGQAAPNTVLQAKMNGDTMVISPPATVP